jgi:RNA-directed DNA polymerase
VSEPEADVTMEAVVERGNLWLAYQRVVSNKGAAGVDGMPVERLGDHLREHWPRLKGELLEGDYRPSPVRGVEIPKPGGKGMRQLGIPTVADRFIQQAVHQVLQRVFEPGFSESSFGFRPGRNAHQAVRQARDYVREGRRWVVDLDLEKFFDRVNHDVLMSRVARKVKDKRLLRLIRRFLQAGLMKEGLAAQRMEGTPQGGPLSPLLSNILLDDLDKELERRGHAFCRYADDCNIYVRSEAAGERVMVSVTRFLEGKLRLKVNADKSAVARPWVRKFLGFSVTWERCSRLRVAKEAVKRFREKLREKFRSGRGRNVRAFVEELGPALRGWKNYFGVAEAKGIFEELDRWVRRRLRLLCWRQWKWPRTRVKKLMQLGLDEKTAHISAFNGYGPWRNSGARHLNQALPMKLFEDMGLVSLCPVT